MRGQFPHVAADRLTTEKDKDPPCSPNRPSPTVLRLPHALVEGVCLAHKQVLPLHFPMPFYAETDYIAETPYPIYGVTPKYLFSPIYAQNQFLTDADYQIQRFLVRAIPTHLNNAEKWFFPIRTDLK